ncbi:DNA-directed RNA polymerases I, II, and III subunit RPABC3 [Mortierella alpina]|uniref:DNA-directed RNA polymerases I, II, and III subunit RPABC3 n=1 Tax=Mortierella alpina TaxID=64518 RepID=A0A9P6LXY0_MORAP|nr:DNA-directed RNA polymerases I, II, and III subunit RPABC3 [Mortierella alpina]
MSSHDKILFSDNFTIGDVDVGAGSLTKSDEMGLTLDVNNELYHLEIGEKVSLVLATSLSCTTTLEADNSEGWRENIGGGRTLADDYEYVIYGKVYKYEEGLGGQV